MHVSSALLIPNAALTLGELVGIGILSWLLVRLGTVVLGAVAQVEVSQDRRLMSDERAEQTRTHWARAVRLLAGLGALGVVAYNAWLTVSGYDAAELLLRQFQHPPALTPRGIAVRLAELVGTLVLIKLIGWIGAQVRDWMVEGLIAAEVVRVEDERVERIGEHFMALVRATLWLLGVMLILELFNAPDGVIR